MPVVFAVTLFVSACLLFLVQPMVGKLVLPLLGGTPAVWNTCLVFFQVLLLAGYAYAHWTTKWLGVRRQAVLHLLLLAVPLAALPIALPAHAAPDEAAIARPALWLIATLLVSVGLPFFVLATSGPLLQRWFAATGHRDAADPYYLYAASNLGSFAALIGYPFLIEPHWTLGEQGHWWAWGYILLALLIALCCMLLLFVSPAGERQRDSRAANAPVALSSTGDEPGKSIIWVLLAAVPSALLVSVTGYLTTDIAAVPLLWVFPLALYLLSFVLAFSRRTWISRRTLAAVLPVLVLILFLAMLTEATEPAWILLPAHLVAMFVAAWLCHAELARRRPPAEHLTGYYFAISLGGALGGMASALVAPLVFSTPESEYALALMAACALAPSVRRKITLWSRRDWQAAIALGLATAAIVVAVQAMRPDPGRWITGVVFGVPLVGVAALMDRPLRFASGLAAVWCASLLFAGPNGRPIVTERNFFGTVRVTREPVRGWHRLVHGNTVHGRQAWVDGVPEPTPLTYYHPNGPAGQLFRMIGNRPGQRIAQCGLGAGALAYYARPDQHWIFYELDPAVVRVARDPAAFTYLRDHLPDCPVVVGDARLQLRHAPDEAYDIIVVDAFSSDAIPVHLLTREALALYLQKLAPGGVLAFHISNRYLDLRPVLGALAADAGLEVCRSRDDSRLTASEEATGASPSVWAVLARKADDLGKMKMNAQWLRVEVPPGFRVWTDDYSNLWGVLQWWGD